MRSEGPGSNFVFFDLSKLELSSAAAFLADQASRAGADGWPPRARVHWILHPSRGVDLLAAAGPGPEFLRSRRTGGDRFFFLNPTGFDWNHLFPLEAHRELDSLQSRVGSDAWMFLENTPGMPSWTAEIGQLVFRASREGLWVQQGAKTVCVPWASAPRQPAFGAWWIVPGQALVSSLPPGPWGDLIEAHPRLLSQVSSSDSGRGPATPSPEAKTALHAVAEARRSPSPSPLHQEILYRSQEFPGLGMKEAVDFEETLGGIRKRSLVANMQGQTNLREQGLQVRFLGGELVRIEEASTGAILCSGAKSYLEWGGARHPFTVNSAFSFEGDFSWGLRQSLVLNHEDLTEPGRAIVDFYFVEESREFFAAVTVRWPRWRHNVTVTRWAPLELTLFDLPMADSLATRVVWPDGQSSDQIHRRTPAGLLTGTDFVFSAGSRSVVLGFPQNQTTRPYFLPWQLVRRWGRSRLTVNPEGGQGDRPSEEFQGIEEHFTLYLTPVDGAKLPFSVTRKQASELIPPYVIHP